MKRTTAWCVRVSTYISLQSPRRHQHQPGSVKQSKAAATRFCNVSCFDIVEIIAILLLRLESIIVSNKKRSECWENLDYCCWGEKKSNIIEDNRNFLNSLRSQQKKVLYTFRSLPSSLLVFMRRWDCMSFWLWTAAQLCRLRMKIYTQYDFFREGSSQMKRKRSQIFFLLVVIVSSFVSFFFLASVGIYFMQAIKKRERTRVVLCLWTQFQAHTQHFPPRDMSWVGASAG